MLIGTYHQKVFQRLDCAAGADALDQKCSHRSLGHGYSAYDDLIGRRYARPDVHALCMIDI